MIVAVCANPALDVTYRVPELTHGNTHAVEATWVRPGGKGTNVARVLSQLDAPVTLVAPLGGASGAAFRDSLDEVTLLPVDIAGTTRTCVSIVDHDATVFNERGPALSEDEWSAVVDAVASVLTEGDVLVLSGSIPRGVTLDAYADLVALTRTRAAHSIVDAHSQVLERALAARPDVVAPNAAEAATLVGDRDAGTSARLLHDLGAHTAVVSAGTDGLYACVDGDRWRAVPPETVAGNPTGAGDALTAALAAALHSHTPWPDTLRDGVACAAAAVACDVAGEIDLGLRARLLSRITAERY